jgi:hypothetical protein
MWAACGACAAAGVLLVGSQLPIWGAWYFTFHCGVGRHATLQEALAQLPANARALGSYQALWELHLINLVQGAVLVAAATATGVGVFWMASRRRARRFTGPAARAAVGRDTTFFSP